MRRQNDISIVRACQRCQYLVRYRDIENVSRLLNNFNIWDIILMSSPRLVPALSPQYANNSALIMSSLYSNEGLILYFLPTRRPSKTIPCPVDWIRTDYCFLFAFDRYHAEDRKCSTVFVCLFYQLELVVQVFATMAYCLTTWFINAVQ